MMILIDSDVLIEVTRARDSALIRSWIEMSGSDDVLLCSPVTVAELWHGALPREHDALKGLFTALVCVPIDADIGERAGHYLRQYGKSHGVELGDALIAATTVAQGALLWTRNRKHYPMNDLEFYATQ